MVRGHTEVAGTAGACTFERDQRAARGVASASDRPSCHVGQVAFRLSGSPSALVSQLLPFSERAVHLSDSHEGRVTHPELPGEVTLYLSGTKPFELESR
jgi:hypothetical protein